jgi:hypothetical protein
VDVFCPLPRKNAIQPSQWVTTDSPAKKPKPTPKSLTTGKKTSGNIREVREPSFASGYSNGQPIYSVIRILPEETVTLIEEEIQMMEKTVEQFKESDETLIEL